MNNQGVLESGPATDASPPVRPSVRVKATGIAIVCLSIALLAAAWIASQGTLYKSGYGIGYAMGVTGGTLLLLLLLYPLRKRMPWVRNWGPLRHWFRLHMIFGILGPLLILFHSTFRTASLNATVAVICMLLVAGSGVVGRFIYRRIHHGLYGSRASLEELQQSLARELQDIKPMLNPMPAVAAHVEAYAVLAGRKPSGWGQRLLHFATLGWKRWRTERRIARSLEGRSDEVSAAAIESLASHAAATLRAVQRASQFSTYERLFALWHVLHVPFVWLFVISAIVHVVAVHMY